MENDRGYAEELREKYSDEYGFIDKEKLDTDIRKTQRFMFRLHLFMSAVFIFAGLAFILAGSLELWSIYKDKRVCTELTEGYVSDFKSEHSDSSDQSSSMVYAPVFTYTYEGRDYSSCGHSYSDKGDLYVGKKVSVYVCPDDPNTIYVPEYKVAKRNPILFIIIGTALSVGFIGYCFYKKYQVRRDFERLVSNDKG